MAWPSVVEGDLVRIQWLDANFELDEKPNRVGTVCVTVGFLVETRVSGVIVAQEKDEDGEYKAFTSIPHAIVQDIIKLKEERVTGWRKTI